MKQKNIFVIFLCIAFSLFACKSTEENVSAETTQALSEKKAPLPSRTNHSYLSEKNIGERVSIVGILLNDNNYGLSLLENPESKSRVTYVLSSSKEILDKCYSLIGSSVTVTGVLTSVSSPWKKALNVESVE